ncbi:polycystic kidney disease protein 1-like 2 [Lingula anatina]|uniref:Polycystic kidney disease protein 1-like 2 n=1 Tax=Lingula anatina TaxID=7574 RepID=A0A1S3I5A1_LINAN|nr:polycystic kidney disease protein 1-like 2 [Lingula anatina]|eukprot:XP_013393442.1 polycystic kidney disease protein 1-like 2 [Lingula anatina]
MAARAEKSEQLVNSIGDTILGGMNTSSPPVVINTKSVAMTLQKVAGSQAAAGNFTTSSTTIKINGALATTEPVNVKLVAMADNAFKYAPGGSNVTSGVTTFEMKTDSGQMAALDGGFVEAEVGAAMKFEETQANMENMTTDNGISQTIAIQDAAILLSFDIPPDQTLVFLGKLDGEATKQSYDFRFVVSSAVESSDKNIDVNEEFDNGTLVIVVPQEALGTAQKLGLSVLLAEESATSSGGGSSRRLLSTGGNGTLSMRSTAITPSSYNRTSKSWGSPSGLKIKGASKSNKVVFKSNFFGSFAAGLFVPPNTIDFGKVFGNFSALLAQAPHVLIVMSSLVALYFLLFIWARRKDKQDMENWVHHHLLENQRWDQQHYLLSVFTSSKSPKHTTAIPYVILYGTEGRTKPKVLLDRSRENFKSGKVCNFVLSTPRSLGRLTHLHVWHCQVDDASSWHLDKITVYDVTTKDRYLFLCDEWLSICKDDGNTDRLLTAADETALEDFSFLLSNNAKKKIFDDHLWFSVAKRPTPSRLTRVQRLTTCLAVLFLCMISNAMFYTENEDKGNGIAIGPIVITFRQVYVGLIASVLVVPPTFIMLEVFRRSRPRKTDKSIFPYKADKWAVARKALVPEEKDEKMFKAVENVLAIHKEAKTKDDKSDLVKAIAEFDEMMRESPPPPPETPAKPPNPPRKPVRFPWWFVVFGYILAFVAVFTSAFFTLLYSLEWGATKSTNWLLALFFALGESVLVVQPLQVLLLALIMSIIMRMPGDDETDDDFVIEEHVLLPYNYTIPKAVFVPMADTTIDEEEIKMRKLQKKHEQKLSGVVNDIAVHLGYLFLLLVICFANRDPNFFLQNDNLRNSLSLDDGTFSEIQRMETIFSWLNGTIFPAVFPDTDYTGAALDAYDQQFLHDIYALRLGPLRLRQHRVVQGHCTVIPHMTNLFNSCNTDYSFERQDKVNYQPGWEAGLNAGVDASATAFNHTSPNGDKDLWVSGLFSLYDGGGYAVEVNSLAEGITVLNTLLANNWIDRLTRVVFVEFTINNMNVNVFSMVRIKLELPAIGGIFVTRELVSFRPYPYVNPFDFILLVIQVIWAIVVFYLLVKESISMFKKRSKYFKVLWNYAILIDLLFAVASMVCFVLRTVYVIRSVEDVKNNNGHFVGFDLVANWDFGYSLTIAISLFVATLHLFRPLSFHKLLSILSTTLTRSFLDLLSYAVIFIICLFTFGLTLMVNSGSVLAAFRAIAFAMFNLFGVMLGVLKYTDVITEETFLLKVFFFIFTMSMNFMLLNMFISIINDTLAEVPV